MYNLSDLYSKRQVFLDYGAPIPDSLASEIKEAEASMSDEVNKTFSKIAPSELNVKELNGNVLVAIEYSDGKLSRIGSVPTSQDVFSAFDMNVMTIDIEDEYFDYETTEITRSKSIPFSVTFPDGKVFRYNKAQWTLIDSLKHMGLERASHFTGETFKGFPLVGKRQRITPKGQKWQKKIDGWWIYINMSNSRKIRCIEGVAKMLNIPVIIELLQPPQ